VSRKIENRVFYKASLKKHKNDVKALHWNSKESQEIRFEIIDKLLPSNLEDATLVDAGCGFGDFYLYLQSKNHLPKNYIGLDVMPEMVCEAKKRTAQNIYKCDIIYEELPQADYYICSGAMNILSRFETHLFIQQCLKASNKAFIFNLLEGEDDSMVYNHFFPSEIKSLAKELKVRIEIIRGYMPYDFTTCLSKKED